MTIEGRCAHCAKPVTTRVNVEYRYVRMVHVGGGYFCYNKGPERAELPIIHEEPV
jgi:hypothetical protein